MSTGLTWRIVETKHTTVYSITVSYDIIPYSGCRSCGNKGKEKNERKKQLLRLSCPFHPGVQLLLSPFVLSYSVWACSPLSCLAQRMQTCSLLHIPLVQLTFEDFILFPSCFRLSSFFFVACLLARLLTLLYNKHLVGTFVLACSPYIQIRPHNAQHIASDSELVRFSPYCKTSKVRMKSGTHAYSKKKKRLKKKGPHLLFCSFVSALKKLDPHQHQPSTCFTLIQTNTRPSALWTTDRIHPWPLQRRPRVAESCRLILQPHLFFSTLLLPPNGTKYVFVSGPCGHLRWTLHVTTSTYSSNPSWARVYCPIHPHVPDQPQRTPILCTIAIYPSHALREFRLVAR